MHIISSFLMAATKSSFYNQPSWQRWSKAAASHEHIAPLTHIAFQKIYLKSCTTATRGKGKKSKKGTIMADIEVSFLNLIYSSFMMMMTHNLCICSIHLD